MTFFYRSLRQILRLSLELYFLNVQVKGRGNVPDEGPVIFASNHPNSIMDAVILTTQLRRPVHYMAKSILFENVLVKAIFKQCGVIPVYSSAYGSKEKRVRLFQNKESFRRAYEVLEEGNCIGVFPEGRNSPDRRVLTLKKGTARLALGAESKNQKRLELKIIPVGLSFDDRDRFLSSVLLRFGEPIFVSEYLEQYAKEKDEGIQALTDRIEGDMRSLAIHIHDADNRQLVLDMHRIYGSEFIQSFSNQGGNQTYFPLKRFIDSLRGTSGFRPDLVSHFQGEQDLADALKFHQESHPEFIARLRMDVRRYKDHLEQVRLRYDFDSEPLKSLPLHRESIKATLYSFVASPIAVWGFLHNFIPYVLMRAFTSRVKDEALRAITVFVAGGVAFPLFYFLYGWGLWVLTEKSLIGSILYVSTLPLSGIFFLGYWQKILMYRDRILSRTFLHTKKGLVEELKRERGRLIEAFEVLQGQCRFAQEQSQLDIKRQVASENAEFASSIFSGKASVLEPVRDP
jgi:glycerol-3-phosphate O-acyltransferase / dihydroxyacetone phosphate acyltransferase